MHNEITARRQYSVKQLHKQSRSNRFLAGDVVEIPLHCRKHGCNEERSRATSLDRYISLRIPWALTAVYGWLELLATFREQQDTSMQATYLSKAMDRCQELIHLVNNVLETAHVTGDVKHPQPEECLVAQAVREELEHFDPREVQAHAIQLDVPEQLSVWADRQYLRQVLRNLLSNAFKYAPQHTSVVISATLYDTTAQGTDSAPHVCICVKDAGPGIPPAELPLLFEKFVRLERDLAGPVRGSGLGLYISKQLVETMGGHIWAESTGRAGEGSRFYFTLPKRACFERKC